MNMTTTTTMYALIHDKGFQLRVNEGDIVNVPLRDAKVGSTVTFEQVLLVSDGKSVQVGAPLVQGAKVVATVQGVEQGPKVHPFYKRPKKDSQKKTGHRQRYLAVRIDKIHGPRG